jgi:hypothetical protein
VTHVHDDGPAGGVMFLIVASVKLAAAVVVVAAAGLALVSALSAAMGLVPAHVTVAVSARIVTGWVSSHVTCVRGTNPGG